MGHMARRFAQPVLAPRLGDGLGERWLHAGIDVAQAEEALRLAADTGGGQEKDLLGLDIVEAERFQEDGERLAGGIVEARFDEVAVDLEAAGYGLDHRVVLA